jgi:hypothetical protein
LLDLQIAVRLGQRDRRNPSAAIRHQHCLKHWPPVVGRSGARLDILIDDKSFDRQWRAVESRCEGIDTSPRSRPADKQRLSTRGRRVRTASEVRAYGGNTTAGNTDIGENGVGRGYERATADNKIKNPS